MFKPLLPATVARYPLRCTQEEASAEATETAAEDDGAEQMRQTAYARPRPKAQPITKAPMVPAQPVIVPRSVSEWFPSVEKPYVPLVLGMRGNGNFSSFDTITATLLDGCINTVWYPVQIDGSIAKSFDEPIYRAENGYTFARLADGWYLSAEPFSCVKTASTQD